jgi:hypothetical protein
MESRRGSIFVKSSARVGLITLKECPWWLAYGGEVEIRREKMMGREKSMREERLRRV